VTIAANDVVVDGVTIEQGVSATSGVDQTAREGGGIYNPSFASVVLRNVELFDNRGDDGVALYNGGSIELDSVSVIASNGGPAITNDGGTLTAVDLYCNANVNMGTRDGACIANVNAATLTVDASRIFWGLSFGRGGGVFNDGASTATIERTVFTTNQGT